MAVVDGLPDQPPGAPAGPEAFDEDTAQGNSVVLELGSGQYAYYAALRPDSIIVKPGTIVRKGQPLAQIGNSGNSTSPHLHFELLSAPDRIGAQGLPFVLTSFGYSGRIDRGRLAVRGLPGPFADSRLAVPQVRSGAAPARPQHPRLRVELGLVGEPAALTRRRVSAARRAGRTRVARRRAAAAARR